MRRSPGFTILELMIVLGLSSVLMSIGISLVHRFMHLHSAVKKYEITQQSSLRLARQIRADILESDSFDYLEGESLLLLQPATAAEWKSISYSFDATRVERNRLEPSDLNHHETYPFPNCKQADLKVLYSPKRIQLSILQQDQSRTVLLLEASINPKEAPE